MESNKCTGAGTDLVGLAQRGHDHDGCRLWQRGAGGARPAHLRLGHHRLALLLDARGQELGLKGHLSQGVQHLRRRGVQAKVSQGKQSLDQQQEAWATNRGHWCTWQEQARHAAPSAPTCHSMGWPVMPLRSGECTWNTVWWKSV